MQDIINTYDSLDSEYLQIAKDYLNLEESTMDRALERHTSIYAFFGAVLAYAKRKVDQEDIKLEHYEAKKREVRREELVQSGQKVTERALDGYVKTVPEVITQQTTVLECQHRYNLSKNILNSLDHQKDMLVQMSANKRAEAKLVSDLG
tara:strand:+ start:15 stop:461 length:447 start_codon:yes stop_codon:yes gene_type:complete